MWKKILKKKFSSLDYWHQLIHQMQKKKWSLLVGFTLSNHGCFAGSRAAGARRLDWTPKWNFRSPVDFSFSHSFSTSLLPPFGHSSPVVDSRIRVDWAHAYLYFISSLWNICCFLRFSYYLVCSFVSKPYHLHLQPCHPCFSQGFFQLVVFAIFGLFVCLQICLSLNIFWFIFCFEGNYGFESFDP